MFKSKISVIKIQAHFFKNLIILNPDVSFDLFYKLLFQRCRFLSNVVCFYFFIYKNVFLLFSLVLQKNIIYYKRKIKMRKLSPILVFLGLNLEKAYAL